MGDHADPIPLCQELIDAVIDHLKDDITTLQSCRLVSKDFQKQTHRVKMYLFRKIVFPYLYRPRISNKAPRYKQALLGLAPHVRNLIVHKEKREPTSRQQMMPTTGPDDFNVEDISRFENLETLGIVNAFWTKSQFASGSTLSESLTTLEFSAGPTVYTDNLAIPSVRRLLRFIFAFPNLSSLGLQRVRLISPPGEKVDDLMMVAGPTLRKLRLGFKAHHKGDRIAVKRFVSVLRAVAIDPSALKELYISGYNNGIELVKSCKALCVLTLVLENVDLNKTPAIALRHIRYLTIGFCVSNIDEIDEATLEWFRLSLLDTTRPMRLKHFTLRCNGHGGEDTFGCAHKLRRPLQPIDEILSNLPLKTFTMTTSYDDFQDNPMCINHVSMIHQGICACFSAMKKRRVGRGEHKEMESEPGWRIMQGFPILEGWYARTAYQLKRI